MKDIELLNELEHKIREMASSLDREREKNIESSKGVMNSKKLSEIEDRVKNLIKMLDQMED
ncbi:MAG: hypothetical protein CMG04_08395 [Candidatus Marinimicrobia bacterium]|nr:hypothetical protein [Candidatus Neomarinimicrobiota bacterium]|tara:strand:- start:85 stop:267 length:183 start_codon:yes stop_codon:yes gene_type:complete